MIHQKLLDLLKLIVNNEETLKNSRLKRNAFTRKRSMQFSDTLSFMLDMRKTTLQTRLNLFFSKMKGGEPISRQAFSKLRANFDHSPFETMLRVLVKHEYSGEYELPEWNGFHILAVDGSYLQLPQTRELADEYGIRGGGNRPSAGISVLYDVLHGWPLDPIITNTNMNEREECGKHIDFLIRELPNIVPNSVLVLDRGYPSLDLFEKLEDAGLRFLVRCTRRSASEISSAPVGDSLVTLKNGLHVRVVKLTLPSGEPEILVTNLFDLPEVAFPELYSLRWGIESMYFRLKCEVCVEKFSGKTPNSIRQDFWASMVLMISVAVFQNQADQLLEDRRTVSPTKYLNRARTSDLIVTLRDRFVFANLCGYPLIAQMENQDIIATIARSVSPVRPGRSFPRHSAPAQAFNFNLKSHL